MSQVDLERIFNNQKNDPVNKDRRFIEDGYVDYEKFKKAKKKILFILKEAHVRDETSEGSTIDWVNNYLNIELRNEMPSAQRRASTFMLRSLAVQLAGMKGEEILIEFPKNCEDLLQNIKQVAIMNLNKSGGSNRVKGKPYNEYIKNNEKYIENQIDTIIDSAMDEGLIIACCGAGAKDRVCNIKRFNADIISLQHPSNRKSYDDKHNEALSAVKI